MRRLWIALLLLAGIPVATFAFMQFPMSDSTAEYAATAPTDTIAHLQKQLDSGEVQLTYDEKWGYLPSLLNALHIPPSSQSLVFSKSSFQLDKIAPWSPRAIYFNDDVYIGWVFHGTVLEIASVDPKLGAAFYTLDQQQADKPHFERQVSNCLQCHDSKLNTGGVPGFVVQSVYTDRYGYPLPMMSNPVSTDHTPFEERFGGWFVTGTHGDQVHMGNIVPAKEAREIGNVPIYISRLDRTVSGNLTDLNRFFKTTEYLSRGSDIVALMLLTHQTYLHNLMNLAQADGRVGPNSRAEALVRGLLFYREAKLNAPVRGSREFADAFAAEGPRDHQGRSLRDLDFNTRLLKYPLSYLIYSEGFESLQPIIKKYVARRLNEILSGKDTNPEFAYLSPEDRQAVLEILKETKPDFLPVDTDDAP